MKSNLIRAAGAVLTLFALAALPSVASARGGGHGGGGHGGHGGGHHGGGHHFGGHHYGGHHYGGHHYGGHHYGGHHYGGYHSGRSYAHYGNGYGGRSYSYGYHNPGYAVRQAYGYSSNVFNGYHRRHRYPYPYGNSYFFGYNSPFGLLNYGGYGYGGYGYGYGNSWPYYYYQPNCAWNMPAANTYVSAVNAYPVQQAAAPLAADAANSTISGYAVDGEANFKLGNYVAAENDFRHALVDDPNNGALMMLLAQSLFANGKFDESAGAVQRGMQMLPQDKWGSVVTNYANLYRGNQDYTDQLRKLESARLATSSPALQFLLGYHYGYLGYPKHATTELDKATKLAPQDQAAQKLLAVMAAK